jgi:hypothetical protein
MTYAQTARYQSGYGNTPQGWFNTAEGQQYKNQANPWAGQVQNLQSAMGGFNPSNPSSSTGIWGTYNGYKAPDITDPATISGMGSYRNMMQGDMQRNVQDYVKRAATAGAQRGGMALGGVAPQESALNLAAIRDIGSQTTGLNREALDYLTNKNKWDYSLQRNQMSDWLAGQNSINSALGQQSAWDQARFKNYQNAWNDTPAAIMRGASYSDQANQGAQQMYNQQVQQNQNDYNQGLWKQATLGQGPDGGGFIPQSNQYLSYLMGAPGRR